MRKECEIMKKKNKNFNKIIASTVTASVVVSSLMTVVPNANAAATKFKDVQSNAYFYEAVNSLHARNIISGYEDGTFRPNEPLTRAHAAKII
ncbi:S-layer homology domain-containing protein, partial [Clostridioides difficile]|nr:S-layer homology domain-containing protein [Clostridioides difficile]